MKYLKRVVVASAFVFMTDPSVALAQKQRAWNGAVTATIYDAQDTYPLAVGSDGRGEYTTTKGVSSSINISGSGDWILDTGYGSPRAARLARVNLSAATEETSAAAAPFGEDEVAVYMILRAGARGVNLPGMSLGESALCPLLIHFDSGGRKFRLAMNGQSDYVAPEQQGEDAGVTCTDVASVGCTRWLIEPTGAPTATDPNSRSIGLLFDKQGETWGEGVLIGRYRMSFRIQLSR